LLDPAPAGKVESVGMAKRKPRRGKKKAPRRAGRLRRLFRTLLLASVVAAGAVGYVVYREVSEDLPPVDQLLSYKPPTTTQVFAEDGTMLGEFYVERRYLVPLERVPPHVRSAFLAAEDADFYSHPGIDPFGIARALFANLSSQRVRQGGSTITQQVVKTLLLTPERNIERKVKEVILALRLENKLSKDDILYLYMNQIYFGAGAYGVQAAAKTFFDVDVEDLTIAQAALLAGLPQRPSEYDPQRYPKAARNRQRYVLDRMRAGKFITDEEYEEALAEELDFQPQHQNATYTAAPWYVEHVRRLLEEHFGGTAAAQLGLRVYTAVDLQLQDLAEQTLQRGLRSLAGRQSFRASVRRLSPQRIEPFLKRERARRTPDSSYRHAVVTDVRKDRLVVRTAWETGTVPASQLQLSGGRRLFPSAFRPGDVISVTTGDVVEGTQTFVLDPDPPLEGAMVVIDPYTGQVKAVIGGYSFERSQFNRATQGRRQPGSAIKPLIYAAAFNRGYGPASVVLDAPISLPGGPGGKRWRPKNSGGRYHGPTQLRNALVYSLNTVSVRLVSDIGIDYTRDFLARLPFSRPFPRHLALSLGAVEVSPLELTAAYGIFPTLGKRFEPIFITSITGPDGRPVEFENTKPRFERVLPAEKAYQLTGMMENVVRRGTAKRAQIGRPVAGKTGTTNDNRDAWFVGFTPDLITGVWVGYDSARRLGSGDTGGHAAAPIWASFMSTALKGRPAIPFPAPSGITTMASLDVVDSATQKRSRSATRGAQPASKKRSSASSRSRRRTAPSGELERDAVY
jgi:penicillin-binding protein 1A